MAVDANVIIYERILEELEGVKVNAWPLLMDIKMPIPPS
jgi:hypothetical protein